MERCTPCLPTRHPSQSHLLLIPGSGFDGWESQQMGDKLVLRSLGLIETTQYTLEQSHGVPPVSVVLDNTTLKEENSCSYSSVKTVQSIVHNRYVLNHASGAERKAVHA
jgi:hypothetical protein